MSWLWLAPAVTAVVGMVLVTVATSRAAEEAALLRRELRELGLLRAAVVEVGTARRALAAALEERRRA